MTTPGGTLIHPHSTTVKCDARRRKMHGRIGNGALDPKPRGGRQGVAKGSRVAAWDLLEDTAWHA